MDDGRDEAKGGEGCGETGVEGEGLLVTSVEMSTLGMINFQALVLTISVCSFSMSLYRIGAIGFNEALLNFHSV